MPGLDQRIHRLGKKVLRRRMDCRVKPGNHDPYFKTPRILLALIRPTNLPNILQADFRLWYFPQFELSNVKDRLGSYRQTHQKCTTEAGRIPATYQGFVLRVSRNYGIVLHGKIAQSNALVLIFGRPSTVYVPTDCPAEKLFGHGTCTVRVSKLKKCVEEVPPVNNYASEISLERNQKRYVVFAAPIVLKRIVCGSYGLGARSHPRR
jgi:hypothetical protein